MTLYPHSPDNSFLGFFVDEATKIVYKNKKNIAVVYAKQSSFINDAKIEKYLALISEYFELHFTFLTPCPKNYFCHGVLDQKKYLKLLEKAKLFVGVGFPYEGPAPLEAINVGCVFLNPAIQPPINSLNSDFFRGKPTKRSLTSQNPYCEEFVGTPYVETISITNEPQLRKMLENIKNRTTFHGYLPYEFTPSGMIERIRYYIEKQNFCRQKQRNMLIKPIFGEENESCKVVCSRENMICEPHYFDSINKIKDKNSCSQIETAAKYVLPAIMRIKDEIIMCPQVDSIFFSCVSNYPGAKRVCPCRNYTKGNTAIF